MRDVLTDRLRSLDDDHDDVVEVDVSSCALRDEGVRNVVATALSCQRRRIRVVARSNGVTDEGARAVFERLSADATSTTEETNATTTETNDSESLNTTTTTETAEVVEGGNANDENRPKEKNNVDIDDNNEETTKQKVENDIESEPISSSEAVNDRNTTTTTMTTTPTTNGEGVAEAPAPRDAVAATATTTPRPTVVMESLDLALNALGSSSSKRRKKFNDALRELVGSADACPRTLRFDRCGLGPSHCRAIAKGLIQRFSDHDASSSSSPPPPLSLSLSGNPAIGDAGTAAIAAALLTITKQQRRRRDDAGADNDADNVVLRVLDELDLSSCGVSDAGAAALAASLEGSSVPPRALDLSGNRLTDDGASALGRAVMAPRGPSGRPPLALHLDGHPDVGDRSATVFADAVARGLVRPLSLRSCAIGADGAAAFGGALATMREKTTAQDLGDLRVDVDLSGNALGVHRPPKKRKGAALLKSKASATTASYLNSVGKRLKGGIKDVTGVDLSQYLSASAESDDEFEQDGGGDDEKSAKHGLDASVTARCGARAFARAVVTEKDLDEEPEEDAPGPKNIDNGQRPFYRLGLRNCSLDSGATDALAAAAVVVERRKRIRLVVEVGRDALPLEREEARALSRESGDDDDESRLRDMAERHLRVLRVARDARRRAAEAAAALAAEEDEFDEFDDDQFDLGFARTSLDDDDAYEEDDEEEEYDVDDYDDDDNL